MQRILLVYAGVLLIGGCNFAFPGNSKQNISNGENDFEKQNSEDATREEPTQDCDTLWYAGKRADAAECYERRDGLRIDMLPALVSEENVPQPLKELIADCRKKNMNFERCLEANSKNSNAEPAGIKEDSGNEVGKLPVDFE